MRVAILLLVLILLGGAFSIVTVYQYATGANEEVSNRILTTTNIIKEKDSVANTLILEARYGLRTDYDDLALQVKQLRQATSVFTEGELAEFSTNNAKIKRVLSDFQEKLETKINFIENFKSHNSILRNSLRYAPALGDFLIKESQQKANDKDIEALKQVNEALYRWILSGDNKEVEIIQQKSSSLISLYTKIISAEVLSRYINHIDTTLREQATTQRFINQALNVGIQDSIESVESVYLNHYITLIKSAEQKLYFVFIYALFVLGVALYFWLTMKRNYSRLKIRDQYRSQKISVVHTYLSNSDAHVGFVKDSLMHIKDTLKHLQEIYTETRRSQLDKKKVSSSLSRVMRKYQSLEQQKVIIKTEKMIGKIDDSLDRVSDLVGDMNIEEIPESN